jgi:hypothetical protein
MVEGAVGHDRREREQRSAQQSPADRRPGSERSPLGRGQLGDDREQEVRGGEDAQAGRQHEVAELVALPEATVEQLRCHDRDQRSGSLDGHVQRRVAIREVDERCDADEQREQRCGSRRQHDRSTNAQPGPA